MVAPQILAALPDGALACLLERYGLRVQWLPRGTSLPGSYWGEPEAGLVRNRLYLRPDTPVHSALHEGCHYVCMDPRRRATLDTDAGGDDDDEENAVCYLSIVLAGVLPGYGRAQMLEDMDAWGYSFRLGSARAWFEDDAPEVREWLVTERLIDACERPTFRLRGARDGEPSWLSQHREAALGVDLP